VGGWRPWRSSGGGFLATPVAGCVEDHFVGVRAEPLDVGPGEETAGHDSQPLDELALGGGHRRCLAVSLHHRLVEVGGVGGVEGLEAQVVEGEQVHPGELADHGVVPGTEPGVLGTLQQLIGAVEVHAAVPADSRASEGGEVAPVRRTG